MAKPIQKLCLIRGFTEAYFQLSDEQRNKLWHDVDQAITKAGARKITPYYDSRWSNDKYSMFFIMEYPDIEAAIADTTAVEEAGLFRYMVSETILGRAREE